MFRKKNGLNVRMLSPDLTIKESAVAVGRMGHCQLWTAASASRATVFSRASSREATQPRVQPLTDAQADSRDSLTILLSKALVVFQLAVMPDAVHTSHTAKAPTTSSRVCRRPLALISATRKADTRAVFHRTNLCYRRLGPFRRSGRRMQTVMEMQRLRCSTLVRSLSESMRTVH